MRRLALALALALASPAARAQEAFEEVEPPPPSIQFGPVPETARVALDAGWLRSGLRVDIGLARGFDLTIRGETLSPDPILGDQNGAYAGLRFSPLDEGLRLTFCGEVGFIVVPLRVGSRDLVALRGEVALGYPMFGFLPYVRGAARALRFDAASYSGWDSDFDGGFGVERAFGKLLVGGEVYAWKQSQVKALANWRVRVGWSF